MLTAFAVASLMTAATPAIANPASTYCVSLGGRVEIVATKKGQRGICVLPDGRRIDEWTLFRRDHKAPERPART